MNERAMALYRRDMRNKPRFQMQELTKEEHEACEVIALFAMHALRVVEHRGKIARKVFANICDGPLIISTGVVGERNERHD